MRKRFKILRISVLLTCSLLCLLSPVNLNLHDNLDDPSAPLTWIQLGAAFSECTTGVASGLATPDGRPLLWKNRDVGSWRQEYHYVENDSLPFIGLTYEGNTEEYYAGVNAAGFAIENSDAHNLRGGNPRQNGWGSDPDDGETMALALVTCRTVDDFQAILDSLNEDGRTDDFNYGVFDAFGGAAMFECDGYSYERFDAMDEENGFLIRANFAFSGADTTRDRIGGVHRHDRALMLWKSAVEAGNLTPHYVYQQVVRDLTSRDVDFESLPFDGYHDTDWSTWPYGHIPNSSAINRSSTRSVFVGQGVADGDDPVDAVVWAMTGTPMTAIFTPLWVRAGSVPSEYDADSSRINTRAHRLNEWIYEKGFGVDTWRLTNPQQTGIWDRVLPLETYLFNKTQRFLNSRQFSYEQLEDFQNEVAQQAADSLEAWQPTWNVTQQFEAIFNDNNIVLIWDSDDEARFGGARPVGYDVYRSDHPFRKNERGEFLTRVAEPLFRDRDPPQGKAFYKIEVVF